MLKAKGLRLYSRKATKRKPKKKQQKSQIKSIKLIEIKNLHLPWH